VVKQGSKQQFVKGRSTLATLLETATAVLTELPGVAPSTSLIEAVRAKFMGDEALRQGQWLAAAEQYDVALGSDEAAAILASPAEHAQPPAAPAPLEWESSVWHETRWQSSLRFDESVTAFEFGVCANEAVKLTGATIDDELNLRGELETAGSARLVLVDGAGGESERTLDELAVKLVPGRTLRWSWSSKPAAFPVNRLSPNGAGPLAGRSPSGESDSLNAFAAGAGSASQSAPGAGGGMPEAPGESAGGAPGGPGGKDRLTRRIALPLSYQSPARATKVPSELVTPTWRAFAAVPGALIAAFLGRAFLSAVLVGAVRRVRSAR
jgi:hypothetical protein